MRKGKGMPRICGHNVRVTRVDAAVKHKNMDASLLGRRETNRYSSLLHGQQTAKIHTLKKCLVPIYSTKVAEIIHLLALDRGTNLHERCSLNWKNNSCTQKQSRPNWSSWNPSNLRSSTMIYSRLTCHAFFPLWGLKFVKFDEFVFLGFPRSGGLPLSPTLKHDFLNHHREVSSSLPLKKSPGPLSFLGSNLRLPSHRMHSLVYDYSRHVSSWISRSVSGKEIVGILEKLSPEIFHLYQGYPSYPSSQIWQKCVDLLPWLWIPPAVFFGTNWWPELRQDCFMYIVCV